MKHPILFSSLVLIVLAIGTLLWSGWGERQNLNFKVTIEIETPSGVVSNSTVLQFVSTKYPMRFDHKPYGTTGIFGEAPVLEVSPGQYLFSLNLYEPYGFTKEFARHYGTKSDFDDLVVEKILDDESRPEIYAQKMPILATFVEINKPGSIEEVLPHSLNWAFGNGVKLKSITYQLTDQPVTVGKVADILKWLPTHRGKFVPGTEIGSGSSPNIAGFNRSVLRRHYSCIVDGYTMNNLTYGYWRNGIGCSF